MLSPAHSAALSPLDASTASFESAALAAAAIAATTHATSRLLHLDGRHR